MQAIPENGQLAQLQSPAKAAASAASPHRAAAAAMQAAGSSSQHVPAARRMLVDQRQKWQRITEWISRDSAEAAVASKDSSHAEAASARAIAGSSSAHSLDGPAAGNSVHRVRSPGMETIESVAELRYSLDTTLVDPEQHAMAQAAAAAAAAAVIAANSARHGHMVQTVAAHGLSPRRQQPQQHLQPVPAGFGQSAGGTNGLAPAQHAAVPVAAAYRDSVARMNAAGQAAGAAAADAVVDSSPEAGSVQAMQQQLLQEGQERHRAQQLAAQLQQQVQELLQQQVAANRSFQEQLQQAREEAAAEVHKAQQVRGDTLSSGAVTGTPVRLGLR